MTPWVRRSPRADLVVVTEVYAAREKAVAGVSGRSIADAARAAGSTAHFEVRSRRALGRSVASHLRSGDVVLTLGAGDITRVGPELVGLLQQR